MRFRSLEPWQVWTRVLQIVGGLSLVINTIWFWGLYAYFTSRGPYGPVPERGWTVPLHWTHGFYGTFEENQQLLRLFNWGWWSFWPLFIGTWNRQWREQKNPWRWANPRERLPMNWPYVSTAAVIITTAMAVVAWLITAPVCRAWTKSLPVAGWGSWPPAIIWDVGIFCVLCAFFWKLYCDANTEMSETELRRPSIFGLRRIRWAEVVRIKQVGFGYHVFSKDNKIVLSPYAYKSPESVISMLTSRIQDGQSKAKSDQVPD
jgi:hypothetical protein